MAMVVHLVSRAMQEPDVPPTCPGGAKRGVGAGSLKAAVAPTHRMIGLDLEN